MFVNEMTSRKKRLFSGQIMRVHRLLNQQPDKYSSFWFLQTGFLQLVKKQHCFFIVFSLKVKIIDRDQHGDSLSTFSYWILVLSYTFLFFSFDAVIFYDRFVSHIYYSWNLSKNKQWQCPIANLMRSYRCILVNVSLDDELFWNEDTCTEIIEQTFTICYNDMKSMEISFFF